MKWLFKMAQAGFPVQQNQLLDSVQTPKNKEDFNNSIKQVISLMILISCRRLTLLGLFSDNDLR